MTRSFKIKVEVNEIYELVARVAFQKFDQREGDHYTDYKTDTYIFSSFNDACDWVKKNPKAEIKSFARIENKLEELKTWTKPKGL